MVLQRTYAIISNLQKLIKKRGGLALPFFVWSCSSIPSVQQRIQLFNNLTGTSSFKPVTLKAGPYSLWGAEKLVKGANTLHVYVEGDGVTWIDGRHIADDPTPLNPIGLKLAMADKAAGASILYLARPCQYVMSPCCSKVDWTSGRFSKVIRQAYLTALKDYQQTHNIHRIVLHGYSGGGAMALLVAPHIKGLEKVITFAALFDTEAWVKQFNYLPLEHSLNPANEEGLQHIAQHHYVSENDEVIPISNVYGYLWRMASSNLIRVEVLSQPTHETGWESSPYFTPHE